LIAANTPVLVSIVSASPTIRSGLFALLEREPALAMVQVGDNADVTLLDRTFESTEREATIGDEQIARVLLVAVPTFDTAMRALRAGIRAVVSIDAPSTEITAAVLAAHAGLVAFPALIAESLIGAMTLNAASPGGHSVLTQREREVLQLVGDGHANKEIAQRLGVSEHTAKFHVSSILSKLGVQTRTDAVRLGIKSGLIAL
jgi:DNA-binding NarL/FixJ family response regulator